MNGLFFSFEKILDHFELFFILNSSVSLTSQVPNDFVQIFNNRHEKNVKSMNFHAVGKDSWRLLNRFFRKKFMKKIISKPQKKEKLMCTHYSIPNTIFKLEVLDSVGVKIKFFTHHNVRHIAFFWEAFWSQRKFRCKKWLFDFIAGWYIKLYKNQYIISL